MKAGFDTEESHVRSTERLLICAALSLLGVQPPPALAQAAGAGFSTVRRVSLEEGLRRLETSNLEVRLARHGLASARALTTRAGARTNPGFSAVHEELGGDGGDYTETILSFAQTLEIGGQRGLRVNAARGTAGAAEARVDAERLRLAFEWRRAYARAAQAEEDLGVLAATTEEFRRVERAGTVRFAEGDVSRFDRSRLRIERARYETLLTQAELRVLEAGRELAMLVAPDSLGQGLLVLPDGGLGEMARPAVPATLEAALLGASRRPEVVAADAQVEAARAALGLQRRERVPDLTLSGGYKHQSDGRTGAVLGLAIPLPLWNRNQGEIAAASAELDAALERRALTLARAENEILGAWETWSAYEARRELLAGGLLPDSEGLLASARVAYEEGEMSLLELLDAADAYRSAREALHRLLADSLIALYELERATGRLVAPAQNLSSAPSAGGAR